MVMLSLASPLVANPLPTPVLQFPRLPFILVLAAASGLALTSVGMTHYMNLAACPLCILQRMLHIVLALAAGFGLALAAAPLARRAVAAAMLLIAATGGFIAGYQSWLQRFSVETNCSANQPWWEQFVYWAGEQAPWLFESNGLCTDPAWKFLDLSLAEWSFLAFAGFAAVSLYTIARR
jgi:protein dithiol:quinone oxidoreductase